MKLVDVLCIGYACWDLNFQIARHPGPDEKIIAESLISEGGGPASNAAFCINRIGGHAAFAGRFGNDTLGDAHINELEQAGVDVSCTLRSDTATPTSSIWVDSEGRRAVVYHRQAPEPLTFNFKHLRPACLLMDGFELEASQQALKLFPNSPSVLDAGSLKDTTRMLCKEVSHIIASKAFATAISQSENSNDWVQCLSTHSASIAITCGNQGVVWRDSNGHEGRIPVNQVSVVDTNAAGDIFHGAFALALSKGNSFHKSLLWANEVAALSVTKAGGRSSCPTKGEIPSLDNSQP
jgi:sulfofructose kinase